MNIDLQNDRQSIPAEFLNPEFVITLNEIRSIICKCDDSADNPNDRVLRNVCLYISKEETESYCLDAYSIYFGFDVYNDSKDDENICGTGEIERTHITSFESLLEILKLISANMQATEAADKEGIMNSKDRAAMILLNLSYFLNQNALLKFNGTAMYIFTPKHTDEYDKDAKSQIPEWVSKYFNVNYTGFGTCMSKEEEEYNYKTFKERFYKFLYCSVCLD